MLTFATARSRVAVFLPDDTTEAKARFNEVQELLLTDGNYLGAIDQVAFTITSKYLTLPPQYCACLGITRNKTPLGIAGRWYRYITSGRGNQDTSFYNQVDDMGLGYSSFVDLQDIDAENGCRLKVVADAAESAGTLLVQGVGTDGETVRTTYSAARIEGERIAISASPATSVEYFRRFAVPGGMIKPATNDRLRVYAVETDATETLVAILQPNETVINLRRYRLPEAYVAEAADGTADAMEIVALLRRQHVDLVGDNELTPISNVNALVLGCQAITFRNAGDGQRYRQSLNEAIDILNNELSSTNPAASYPPPFTSAPGLRTKKSFF